MMRFILSTMAAVVLIPLFATASEGGVHHAPSLWEIIFALTNFTILVGALYFVLRKRSSEFFSSRALNTKLAIENAKKLYDEAYRQFEEIEAKLKNADLEGKKLLQDIKDESESEKQQIVAHAKEIAAKIVADSKMIAKQEVIKAKELLKRESVDLAMGLAQKKIESQITDEDQKRLGASFVQSMQKVV